MRLHPPKPSMRPSPKRNHGCSPGTGSSSTTTHFVPTKGLGGGSFFCSVPQPAARTASATVARINLMSWLLVVEIVFDGGADQVRGADEQGAAARLERMDCRRRIRARRGTPSARRRKRRDPAAAGEDDLRQAVGIEVRGLALH